MRRGAAVSLAIGVGMLVMAGSSMASGEVNLFTLVLVIMVHREQRATVQRGLLETARALAVALDGELRGYIRTLEALADSEHLDSGDLRKFYDVAARARRHHPHR